MKKRMLALLLGLLCAGLTACGSTDTAAKDETPSAPTVEQPEPEPTPEEVRRTAHFEQRVAEPGQLLDRDAAHEEDGDQCRDLLGLYFPAAIPARTCCASERSMY